MTRECKIRCYNWKLYKRFPAMAIRDARLESAWANLDASSLAASLDRKQRPSDRLRLMTRGEAIATADDIPRVAAICHADPTRLIWCPTRAWRKLPLRRAIERDLFPIANLALLASTDISTTRPSYSMLRRRQWSTMYFGDRDPAAHYGGRFFSCPKTLRGIKGHCGICKAGCFARPVLDRRVDVNLGIPH